MVQMLQVPNKVYPHDRPGSMANGKTPRKTHDDVVNFGQQNHRILPFQFIDKNYEECYQSFRQQQQRRTYFITVSFGVLFGLTIIVGEVMSITHGDWSHMALGSVIVLVNVVVGIAIRVCRVHDRMAVILFATIWVTESLQISIHLIISSHSHLEHSHDIIWQILLIYICYTVIPVSYRWCMALSFTSGVVHLTIMSIIYMKEDGTTTDFLKQVSAYLFIDFPL